MSIERQRVSCWRTLGCEVRKKQAKFLSSQELGWYLIGLQDGTNSIEQLPGAEFHIQKWCKLKFWDLFLAMESSAIPTDRCKL